MDCVRSGIRLWDEGEWISVPVAVHREVSAVERKNRFDRVALGRIQERQIRQLRAEVRILAIAAFHPNCRVFFKWKTFDNVSFEKREQASHAFLGSPQEPSSLGDHQPRRVKRETEFFRLIYADNVG